MFSGSHRATLATIRNPIELTLGCLKLTSDVRLFSDSALSRLEDGYEEKFKDPIMPMLPFRGILKNRIRNGYFVAIVTMDGIVSKDKEAVAAIVAHSNNLPLYKDKLFSMEFFNTNLTGILAAKSLILAHRALIEQGRRVNATYATTTCFYKDINHDFNKILSKDGWRSEGYLSVYKLS